ncbi:MAG: YihA family ribosome biogenesis GTP-binding protein [Xanthomonadaceae bacterium]|jgi:GTP-binding protein|nr:YihA family ribosome biogenesis GTP-binding protein [Xanthomonadaceae bacterium]
MPTNPLQTAEYLKAAHLPHQLPDDSGLEVAFAGRSNAGKSSALNALCQRHGLARTSKTPGRTQQLVYFQVRPGAHLVDLPGYGYAEVPLHLREHWKAFIEGYFQTRQALSGLVVVMDSRHPLKPFDRQMLDFAFRRGLACHVLLTKADKLTRSARAQALAEVRKALEGRASVQLFSAPEQLGVEEARAVVAGWLGLGAAAPAKGG